MIEYLAGRTDSPDVNTAPSTGKEVIVVSDMLKEMMDRVAEGSKNVCIHKPENIESYKIEKAPDGSLVHSVRFFDGKEAVMVFKDREFVSCKYGPEAEVKIRKDDPDRSYLL